MKTLGEPKRGFRSAYTSWRRDLAMSISKENVEIKNKILDFEKRIEDMHLNIQKYCQGIEPKLPDWAQLQQDLLLFSKRRIYDLVLSRQLDRVLYKFQNRKSIWIRWVEEFQHAGRDKPEGPPPIPFRNRNS
jgi:hypothetical protein